MKFAANLSGGFAITLDNEWVVSIFFGPGSYCSNYNLDRTEAKRRGWVEAKEDVELLIYKGTSMNAFRIDYDALDEGRLVLRADQDPMTHVPNWRVLQTIDALQTLITPETDPSPLKEYLIIRDTYETSCPVIEDLRKVNAYTERHAIAKVVKHFITKRDDEGYYFKEASGAKIRARLLGPATATDEELDAWYSDFEFVM